MELEAKIHELLAQRSQRRRRAFLSGALREKDGRTHVKPGARTLSETLIDVKAVPARRGFLDEQLRIPSLTPLKRWHVQLQLFELDETTSNGDDTENVSNPQSPLDRSLSALQRDRQCFDVSYGGSTMRITDVRESLLAASDKALCAAEALAFSSTKGGYTTRVVLFRIDKSESIRVRSSLFVPGLQEQVIKLIDDHKHVQALVDALWREER